MLLLRRGLLLACTLVALWATASHLQTAIQIHPRAATPPVPYDADDPAIWVHPSDPTKSVILGTDKDKVDGGLHVWDLQGNKAQVVKLPRPNNVDVRYDFKLGDRSVDVAVVNLRLTKEIKVFEITRRDGTLIDITAAGGIKTPELDKPYGLCLYKRAADGALFVIASSGDGPSSRSLHQYRLWPDGTGKVRGEYVRAFGQGTIIDKVEGLVADDDLGYVYASDEDVAIRKYHADPERGDNAQLAEFGRGDGVRSDREGLAIYECTDKTGHLLVSSQKAEKSGGKNGKNERVSTVKVYRREGDNGNPHAHALLATIETIGSVETDGLEVTNRAALPTYPNGFLVKHDSPGRQFKIYAWDEIAKNLEVACATPRPVGRH
jgi:3-phytase